MKRLLAALALSLAWGAASPAFARDTSLQEAERAYGSVDFAETFTLAEAALAEGGHSPRETARLYLLLGISAAALDKEDAAREAFSVVIALDPEVKLEQNLSPKIRAPYLEARGAFAGRTRIQAALSAGSGAITIALSGSLETVRGVELAFRPKGGADFEVERLEPAAELTFQPPAEAAEVEVALRLVDSHDNSLFDVGTRTSPRAFVLRRNPERHVHTPPSAPRETVNRTPYHVTAAVLAGLGVVAAGAGVVFHLEREDRAEEWNGAGCEEPGSSRADQCAGVDEDRRRAENLAIGLYAGGGALLVSSLVTLLVAPHDPPKQGGGSVRGSATRSGFELSYSGRF
jgi:hypothetical protein